MTESVPAKIPLPAFLKMLTSSNVPPSRAMAVAGKIYKTHSTPEQLSMLTDFSLESAGIAEKDLRKQVLSAVRKAGYKGKSTARSSSTATSPNGGASSSAGKAGPSKTDGKPERKRRRDDDRNELLHSKPRQEGDAYGSLEFDEVLDEEVLQTKFAVINRAPIMMAWAFVVAERLSFGREEALSIASAYTEMNAVTKGVSLGIYRDDSQRGKEASRTGSQPYVELMGRRSVLLPPSHFVRQTGAHACVMLPGSYAAVLPMPISVFVPQISVPLYQTASAQWHALSNGSPVAPTAAFSYIRRALRQTAPHVVGALRLLAASYAPAELNAKGFALYADFRPTSEGWGERAEVRCSTILGLRKSCRDEADDEGVGRVRSAGELVKVEPAESAEGPAASPEGPASKKLKHEPPERDEYDAVLDDDALFNDFDLSSIP